MSDPEGDWRKDSRSFNTVAHLYETYRPGYPAPLIDHIISTTGLSTEQTVLEIGSGTGKATELFARRGFAILCIEPGEHLIEVAAEKLKAFPKVRFEQNTFEDWNDEGRRFDLIISAQAFHWVGKEIRFQKAAQVLNENRSIALFWNKYPPLEDAWASQLNEIYREAAPEIARAETNALPTYEEGIQYWVDELKHSDDFDLMDMQRYPWTTVYTTGQYLGVLNTYSDHLRLSEERRQRLFEKIGKLIDQAGGKIEKQYETVLYLAQKR